mmetsp:Transcript_77364/g.94841  ORF Transcript_77364/g.94841 Transcript_77364/m.94841 type:complete len:239 (+) Transcript_77364:30-746(+)
MNIAADTNSLKSDCVILNEIPNKGIEKFCKISVKSIVDGIKTDQIIKLAKVLEKSQEIIQKCVYAISQLFTILASNTIGEYDEQQFYVNISPLFGFNKNTAKIIYSCYTQYHHTLREMLSQFKIDTPLYHNFDWRLDIQIASRAIHKTVKPVFLCKITTQMNGNESSNKTIKSNDNDDIKTDIGDETNNILSNNNNNKLDDIIFECDYANLDNMISKLSDALNETSQSWYKKVSRQTK